MDKSSQPICEICGKVNNRKNMGDRRNTKPQFYKGSALAYLGYDDKQNGHFYVSDRRRGDIRRLSDSPLTEEPDGTPDN